jgi:glycosyltransferase involved in cell wall biosynthesis
MKNELVSIAMATYNGARFLRKQLDSIYNQSYKNLEIIVCDDKSTDNTVSILDEYRVKKGLYYQINKVNVGYYRNFEKTIGLCNGRYIALADQDDIWVSNKIASLVDAIGDCSMIYSDASFIDDNDKIFAKSILEYTGCPAFSGKSLKQLAFWNSVTGCTVLFKREMLEFAVPFPDGEKYHDWWLALVACKMKGLCFLADQLVLYRRHQANTLGLRKRSTILGKMAGFLTEEPEKETFRIEEQRLESLCANKLFSVDERKFLKIAHDYFHDRLNTRLHVKAFVIALRNHRYIFPTISGIWRVKAILGALLR